MLTSRLIRTALVATVAIILPSANSAFGEEAKSVAVSKEYVDAISKVRADLDAGKTAEALAQLEKTDKSMRGFEYEYLMARAKGAKGSGAAPDLIQTLDRPEAESRYGVLNDTNRELAFICRDGGVVIHSLTSPAAKPKRVAHPDAVAIWSGAFSHDGKRFFSGHENGDVLVWDASKWDTPRKISLGADWPVRELVVAPDGSAFVAESQKELELWSLAGDEPKKIAGVGERFNFGEGLAFSPQGDQVATGGMFDIKLFDARTGAEIRAMRHASYTMGLEFSPDGKRIASAPRGNVNKFLAVFEVTGEKPLFNAGPFGNYVAGMAYTPDGTRIAATGCENVVRLFDSMNGSIVLELPRKECSAKPAISRDGKLLGWSEPGGYRYIDLASASKAKD